LDRKRGGAQATGSKETDTKSTETQAEKKNRQKQGREWNKEARKMKIDRVHMAHQCQ